MTPEQSSGGGDGPEIAIRDALRRLRAEGVQRMGERVEEVTSSWAALAAAPAWDEAAREATQHLAAATHRLAGAGGTFGYPAISAAAAPLEVMLLGLASRATEDRDQMAQTTRLMQAVRDAWAAGPAAPGTPQALAEAEAAPAGPADGFETVFLFATAAVRGSLAALIATLGYPLVTMDAPGQTGSPGTGGTDTGDTDAGGTGTGGTIDIEALAPMSGRPGTAVVDDALPDALATCARLSASGPVILLAHEGGFAARLAAARAGVSAVVSKPVDVNELADWLDHFATRRSQARFSILVVDDDPLLASAYALALRRAGMLVQVVSDPYQAVEALHATPPDLILMDVQMPGVDGIELARVIRQTRRHLSVPIVFLSAEQDMARQILARQLGGDDFIAKPVDLDRLVTLVGLRAERARALRAVMESDSLTGLLNHARFKERLALELVRAQREGTPISLVIVDLDHFKSVNDTHGHLVGDRVIRGLARSLQKQLRRTDIIGRYGGEEFAVLLPNTLAEAAAIKMDRIRERFAETAFEGAGQSFRVTFSAGLAGDTGRDGPETLISAADACLYAAKRGGRNQVTWEART